MAVSMKYGSDGDNKTAGVRFDLIWTNPDPTATFAAQTISLNLRMYKFIIVVARNFAVGDSNFGMLSQLCLKGVDTAFMVGAYTNNRNGIRVVTPSDTGVTFAACKYNNGTNNNYGVPYYIYGIR